MCARARSAVSQTQIIAEIPYVYLTARISMTLSRSLKWTAGVFFAAVLLAIVFFAVFGWNWLRAPIERMTLEKTGRVLVIGGNLKVSLAWPWPRARAEAVTFANPAWAQEKQMVSADVVDVTIDLPQLLRRNVVFPEVSLERPVVFLEQSADGRKSWLLDLNQRDESAVVQIGRLGLDRGTVGFDDIANKTRIQAALSTGKARADGARDADLVFSATGQYKGQALKVQGTGGPVLAIRDDTTPYPLTIDASVGKTRVQANGTVTSLVKFSAVDLQMQLHGDDLAQLYPLLGIAFPPTRAFETQGHLLHDGTSWRFEKFSGRIGASDVAGSLQVVTGGKRPALTAALASNVLDLADLGPMIGSRAGSVRKAAASGDARARVLPDLPFKADHWDSVDAKVTLHAKTIRRAKELPLENLVTNLTLQDSVLTLDPLDFGLAGGHLNAVISLDGRQDPIQARAKVRARKILISKLFPTVELNQTSIGQINGEFDLSGNGNSVGRMLASANGKVGLVVAGGEISRLMMEKAGLHLWEILEINLTGDKLIKLRCAVADFEVKDGVMHADALIFDTAVTTLMGTGNINLGQETIDLTFNQKTKDTSPLALRSPIYVRGKLVKPEVGVDKGRVAARALGAVVLGMVNPLLALIPLVDAGPGKDSDCAQLVRDARTSPGSTNPGSGPKK